MSALLVVAVFVLSVLVCLLSLGVYVKSTNAVCMSHARLDGRAAVVTGGTLGMGLEVAKDLAARGARVIIAGPDEAEGTAALEQLARVADPSQLVYLPLDLASLRSTRDFANHILTNEPRLDILINNAGVGGPTTASTADNLNFVMQVNYYGALLLTLLLLPLLKKSGKPGAPSRIVNVASILHRMGVADVSGTSFVERMSRRYLLTAYANSKLCLVMFTRELAKRLKNANVVVNASDPGVVGTRIFLTARRRFGWVVTGLFYFLSKTPWQGAQTTLHAALDAGVAGVSGEYFKDCARNRACARAYDEKVAMKLWEESIRLVKLTDEEAERCFK